MNVNCKCIIRQAVNEILLLSLNGKDLMYWTINENESDANRRPQAKTPVTAEKLWLL